MQTTTFNPNEELSTWNVARSDDELRNRVASRLAALVDVELF